MAPDSIGDLGVCKSHFYPPNKETVQLIRLTTKKSYQWDQGLYLVI